MDDYCSQVCASSIYAPWYVIYLLFLNAVVHSICMFFPMKYSISFFFFFFSIQPCYLFNNLENLAVVLVLHT
jgi:hypothetical protein